MLVPVILAGGSGSRLWPLSRADRPKQFWPLAGTRSLLQETVQRLAGLPHDTPYVVCNEQHRFLVAEQLLDVEGQTSAHILLEPCARNTAPAIALAALHARQNGQDPLLLVLPADHAMTDIPAFQNAVRQAATVAGRGFLMTFGVSPSHAATGYGYIKTGTTLSEGGYAIDAFVEKPGPDKAAAYVSSGDYYWNSGMFVFRASRYLAELQRLQPRILACCQQAIEDATHDLDFCRVAVDPMRACPNLSIDYGVMEQTDQAAMVDLDAGWSDLGSWPGLWQQGKKDNNDNVLQGDVWAESCQRTLVRAESRLTVALGVRDLMIVETRDAVLVAHRDQAGNIGALVEKLRTERRPEADSHRQVYRPWGRYDAIDQGARYQVKHITVKPGGQLSLQMHHHRAEHWVVVTGTARVTRGEETFLITENESTYIPAGVAHSMENPGVITLELIEVQSGSYLGKDDIIRLRDVYGRC